MPTKHKNSDPSLTIDGNEMKCHGRRIRLNADEDRDGATFCDPYGSSYVGEIEVFQSFGVDGLETLIRPLVNTIVQVVYTPTELGVAEDPSEANPQYRFDARVPPFAIVDAGIREFSPFTLSLEAEEGTMEKTIDGTTWTKI